MIYGNKHHPIDGKCVCELAHDDDVLDDTRVTLHRCDETIINNFMYMRVCGRTQFARNTEPAHRCVRMRHKLKFCYDKALSNVVAAVADDNIISCCPYYVQLGLNDKLSSDAY